MNQHLITYSSRIKEQAFQLGFSDCGIARACALEEERQHLKGWLQNGMHGEMLYMENHFEKRVDPRLLVKGAKSIVSVLLNYYPTKTQEENDNYIISKYAYGNDYHFVLKGCLQKLLQFINKEIAPCVGRFFVDSAPVLDRVWAVRAGLGWIGKNSNLISRQHGSFCFIGELIIDIELAYDQPSEKNHCGSCTRCMDACPTGAIVTPGVIDARKCVAYQTIEQKEDIDKTLQGKIGNRIFGCDTCQDVCPWNQHTQPHNIAEFDPHPELLNLRKEEWENIDRNTFNKLFRKSAIKRIGLEKLKRNIDFVKKG